MRASISHEERLWRARAASVARSVNIGWWWHRFSPALVGVNLAGAAALLLFRQMRWPLSAWAVLLAACWVVASAWAWWRARARFYSQAEALLRLETHLGWHNVLSTAAQGAIGWPELPHESVRPLQWLWGKSVQPVLASLAFLLAAVFIPVGAPPKPYLPPPAQLPPALQQVEAWTRQLKDQQLVEPAMMDTWDQKLEQLKQKPNQDWYGQESLEADESLRNQLAQEMDTLGKNLKKASDLVDAMQNLPAGASMPADLNSSVSRQASALQNGNLPLRQDLAQQLDNAQSLSQSQLQDLKNELQQGANAVSAMQSGSPMSAQSPGQAGQNNSQSQNAGNQGNPKSNNNQSNSQNQQAGQGQSGQSGQSSNNFQSGQPNSGQQGQQGQGQQGQSQQGQGQMGQGQQSQGQQGQSGQGQQGQGQGQQGQGQQGQQGQAQQGQGQGQQGEGQGQGEQGQGQGQGQQGQGQGQDGQGQGANGNAPGQVGPHGNDINNGIGSGGPGGGGGSGGLTYESPTDVQSQNKQGVSNNKSDSVLPGDIVGMSKSAPPKDSKDTTDSGAGGPAAANMDAEAVWRQDLTPQERALLQQYFK